MCIRQAIPTPAGNAVNLGSTLGHSSDFRMGVKKGELHTQEKKHSYLTARINRRNGTPHRVRLNIVGPSVLVVLSLADHLQNCRVAAAMETRHSHRLHFRVYHLFSIYIEAYDTSAVRIQGPWTRTDHGHICWFFSRARAGSQSPSMAPPHLSFPRTHWRTPDREQDLQLSSLWCFEETLSWV